MELELDTKNCTVPAGLHREKTIVTQLMDVYAQRIGCNFLLCRFGLRDTRTLETNTISLTLPTPN